MTDPNLSLRAKRSNLYSQCVLGRNPRLLRRFAPRNDICPSSVLTAGFVITFRGLISRVPRDYYWAAPPGLRSARLLTACGAKETIHLQKSGFPRILFLLIPSPSGDLLHKSGFPKLSLLHPAGRAAHDCRDLSPAIC